MKATSIDERRRCPFGSLAWGLPFDGLVDVAGKHDCTELRAQVADPDQQGNADGNLLGAPVVNVDVGDREKRARRVGSPAELAGDNRAFDRP